MIANAESAQQDARSERDRILAYVNDCNEGVSCISASIGTGIKRSTVESILKSLVEEHAINSAWSTKGGYCMYYPCPEPKKEVITRPPQKDRLAEYERKVEAGEVPTPDPVADRAAPDRFPLEEKTNKCRFCGKVKEKYLWQHENYCKENPDHKTPPGVATKKVKEEGSKELSTPVDDGARDIARDPPGTDRQVTNEPAPFTKTSQSVLCTVCRQEVTALPWSKRGINYCSFECLERDELARKLNEKPADPLAAFAQQHRVRVGREISKLKRVERKLRRRAAAAEAMADRVHSARRTKERELRRFEKDLVKVSS